MHSYNRSRQGLGRREEGIALIVTLLVMMLISVLMVGFVASIVADTRASGFDRDQTRAYASAHAGLEQITTDLSRLFETDFSPNSAQVAGIRVNPPALEGFAFVAPGDTVVGSGYMVVPRYTVTTPGPTFGDPLPEDPVNGSAITSGPYQGFRGIITPYDITVTSRGCPGGPPCETARGGAEVRMRRTLQTVAIPVFQFGMFSETDLAFHAGSDGFSFGGRVHTNGNLFLAAATGTDLTIGDRITAGLDIIRTHLPNGLPTATGYTGNVRIPTTIVDGSVVTSSTYRNLKVNEGSLTGTLPRVELPAPGNLNPTWTGLSVATYKNNIRNSDTGAKRLELPIVGDRNGDHIPDAAPIDLIRRPPPTEAATSLIFAQRYFGQASLRILLSDTQAELTGLPGVVLPGNAVNLSPTNATSGLLYAGALPPLTRPPLAAAVFANATAAGNAVAGTGIPAGVYKSWNTAVNGGAPLLGGWIKIEMQLNNNTWQDVTQEILGLGIAGRNLASSTTTPVASRWNSVGTGASLCPEPNPNAIIRLQRVRDVPTSMAPCGVTPTNATSATTLTAVSLDPTDYFPNTLYDPREANVRDGLADTTDIVLGGVMHYIELDVNNLRRWLLPAGSPGKIAGSGANAKNDNGYIVYFSDRRNNKNDDVPAVETGEYGWEHTVNLGNAAGNVYTALDAGEDVNGSGAADIYGRTAKTAHVVGFTSPAPNTIAGSPLLAGALVTQALTGSTSRLVARANKAIFFRRALKVVNGGIITAATPYSCSNALAVPCNNIIAPGLTVVSENPVYLQGNYNATAASVVAEPNVAAAIIADAVTILSNRWNDIRSFNSPTNAQLNKGDGGTAEAFYYRGSDSTGYRVAIVTGKTLPFPKPAYADASFGSDGGAHNFLRSLEDWTGAGVFTRYRGSMVSFFISRQATGSFKCCDSDVYTRGDRDWTFDTDFLLPARLPPGTPMFRDVNTLTFRQLLRPTQ